ncbi:MAG: TIGR00159 family protein [Candidatus Omnitrophica bacterium]|nr:Cyclic di-AMP synthase CdaA [bacterium]NUN97184.1 TIGR00159 family protein [Candidatus Omnitrophota bacterium]
MDSFLTGARNGLDILAIAVAVYMILRFLKGSRAMSVLYGLLTLGGVYVLARTLGFMAFTELINRLAGVALIVVVIVFQPEIRRGLARLGVHPIFQRVFQSDKDIIREIVKAANRLAAKRNGALVVLTRRSGLKAITDSGTRLDSEVSADLIESIFNPYSPLHDGAIIITKERIVAAGCLLPLTEREQPRELGTRHRAAVGITEESDAVVVVVSEERGKISLAHNGELARDLNPDQLNRQLATMMAGLGEED